ncbi:MAG: FtsX-like permease family protein [Chitinophagaceae bacterium]|nr:MAG: FtsX-like permease family protein [Chitinophagaceae bacterium]
MFKLNLRIAFRNLLKNKAYTAINVVGLALGLAGFIFVLLYVNHEESYDRWDASLKDVYQIQELDRWEIKEGKEEWMEATDLRFSDLVIVAMPQVESLTRMGFSMPQSILLENREPFLQKGLIYADENFFTIFPFRFIYGNAATALTKPGSIVIKEQFSRRHFGYVNPIGKIIGINQQNWTKPQLFTITGVVREPETPSTLAFEMVQSPTRKRVVEPHTIDYAITYVKMKSGLPLEVLNKTAQSLYYPLMEATYKKWGQTMQEFTYRNLKPSVRLVPLQRIHHEPLNGSKSWFDLIKPIVLLSTLLLVISIINFVNMFTAQAIARAKEVGIKKVIGAKRRSLIFQFLAETAMQCTIALLVSVMLLEGFLPYLNQLFNLSLTFSFSQYNLLIILELIALLIVVTLLAGIYPAFFLSSYQPQVVLKGSFSHSQKGKILRSILVSLQFVIAVGFFIGVLVISKQVKYMEQKDPGFDATSVICINDHFDKRIAKQIERIDGVEYLGSNGGMISRNQKHMGIYRFNNQRRELTTVMVYRDGLNALNPKLLKGRLFEKNNSQDSLSSVILNESLDKLYGGNMVGKFIYVNDSIPAQVVGVIKDIQVSGFEDKIEPTVFTAAKVNATGYPNDGLNYVIRFDPKKQKSVLADLEKLWKREFPTYPLNYTFIKDDLSAVLIAHYRFKQMVRVFSFLSITLSLIGLFSLAAFLTKQRTKEIAIRKILGADSKTLFFLLNKGYFWLMLCANIISWPLIYIAVDYWLKGFAYRINISLLPFAIAFMVSMIITIITVSLQVKNAVKANPVDALKYE